MKKALLGLLLIPLVFFAFVKPRPDLTVIGFVNMEDGLGRQSVELIEALKDDLRISFVQTRKPKKIPSNMHPFLKKRKPRFGKVVLFEEMLWWPNHNKYRRILKSHEEAIRIAYSMWESTQIPEEWVVILNQYFDAVAVPSPFLVEVYRNSGVEIPIFILPLGLNLQEFLSQPLKEKANSPFLFGNLSVCSERKNQVLLVRAFGKAFGNDPSVRLQINSRYGESEVRLAIFAEIKKLGLQNVSFTQESLPKEEYLAAFENIDCYVSPSKGEGFSIQPREAMALGIPTIVTDNTGQGVIAESGLVKTVSSPLRQTAIFPWGDIYGEYFSCTEDELAEAMIEVRRNYPVYLAKRAEARKWAAQYQYAQLKDLYHSLVKPAHITLGDKNEIVEGGIITNSAALYEKYQKHFRKTLSFSRD